MLELYAIQNSDGQWFRAKGYGGGGKTWVDDLTKARIYPKISTARAQVTYFVKHHPEYPPPVLVRLVVTKVEVVDETERITKVLKDAKTTEAKSVVHRKKQQLEVAQRELQEAQEWLLRTNEEQ